MEISKNVARNQFVEYKEISSDDSPNTFTKPSNQISSSYTNSSEIHNLSDKVRSLLNHVKYGWGVQIRPSFSSGDPVTFMGKTYLERAEINDRDCQFQDMDKFSDMFASRLYFSYRENFEPIDGSEPYHKISVPSFMSEGTHPTARSFKIESYESSMDIPFSSNKRKFSHGAFLSRHKNDLLHSSPNTSSTSLPLSLRTSDCGWGCMLRSGQMIFAEAFARHFLSDSWSCMNKGKPSMNRETDTQLRKIIRWFNDKRCASAPFSIHNMLSASGRKPGEWFCPTNVCTSLLSSMVEGRKTICELKELEVYLAQDRVICVQEVRALLGDDPANAAIHKTTAYSITDHTGNHCVHPTLLTDENLAKDPLMAASLIPSRKPRALIILIPLMLGVRERIELDYLPVIMEFMRDPNCIGLIGGKPKHSIYITGYHRNKVLYYDPHFCQPYVDPADEKANLDTFHFHIPKLLSSQRLDPSCAVGFYCRNLNEVNSLLERLSSKTNCAHTVIEVLYPNKEIRSHSTVQNTVISEPFYCDEGANVFVADDLDVIEEDGTYDFLSLDF